MAGKRKTKVFVSYSRHDESLVRPLAALLETAAGEDSIFLDVERLKAGDPWETKIVAAISECSVFVLCWCCETEKSTFVAKEIKLALRDDKKRLIPVLLCSTELPPRLLSRQWIDMRERIVHRCDHGPVTKNGVKDHMVSKGHSLAPRNYSGSGASTHPTGDWERLGISTTKYFRNEKDAEAQRLATTIRLYFNTLQVKSEGHPSHGESEHP